MIDFEFKECATCAAKPGMPTLCGSCLHNREVISLLKQRLDKWLESPTKYAALLQAEAARDLLEKQLQHAVSENIAFNVKVSIEINDLRRELNETQQELARVKEERRSLQTIGRYVVHTQAPRPLERKHADSCLKCGVELGAVTGAWHTRIGMCCYRCGEDIEGGRATPPSGSDKP